MKKRRKVLIGMSGGVDSSVAAALLVEQGFDVTGGFIKNWSDAQDLWTGECQWRGERRDALRVAARLDISLLTFDFEHLYRERVVACLFEGYARGMTPNPDVLCNQEIKFGLFFDEAERMGFDAVATGHYARTSNGHLFKGVDAEKDQSYFLHCVPREVLSKTLFPIGEMTKSEVRKEAERLGLPTAKKPDSQGICFIGKTDFHDFLRKKIPPTPGEIVTSEGYVIGHHDGLDAATIGQRQGLGVSKDRKAWYVAGKDRERNRLIVVSDRNHPLLWKRDIVLHDVHWIHPLENASFDVVIRYHSTPVACQISSFDAPRYKLQVLSRAESRDGRSFWAPAPGQSAVLYQDEECLGGGCIAEM